MDDSLLQCDHNGFGQHDCTHDEDAGVKCFMTCKDFFLYKIFVIVLKIIFMCKAELCTDSDVRLVGGKNESEGRVEVCFSNMWGTVCDDDWDDGDASAVCKQLGYTGIKNQYTHCIHLIAICLSIGGEAVCCADFGEGSGPILLDDVSCDFLSDDLLLCDHNGLGNHDCTHIEDAGVICHDSKSYFELLIYINIVLCFSS